MKQYSQHKTNGNKAAWRTTCLGAGGNGESASCRPPHQTARCGKEIPPFAHAYEPLEDNRPMIDWPEAKAILAEGPPIDHYTTRVVGVTIDNPDGVNRQQILPLCQNFERIVIMPERDNPVDRYAVLVERRAGQQIGYLPKELARKVSVKMMNGYGFKAYVDELTGGTESCPTQGMVLMIVESRRGVTREEVIEYAEKHNLIGLLPSTERA